MNDYDRAGRYAVKHGPREAKAWLFGARMRYQRWLDAQSAPRPGEPDRRCDTIMEMDDPEGKEPPWLGVIELFTEPDADAVDRAIEYLGRYRGELRHGPHGRDKYDIAVALVFLTGAPRETGLTMNLPELPEVGLWLGPRILDLSAEDAVAHAAAIEQNERGRWLAVWLPLMRGGQTPEMAKRWRALVDAEPRVRTMATLTRVFARLAGCEDVYSQEMEGIVDTVVPFMEEVRQEERLKTRRQAMLEILEARFPGAVPSAVVKRINAEADLARLVRWGKLVGTAKTPEQFLAEMD